MNTYNTRTPHSYINTSIFVLKMFSKIQFFVKRLMLHSVKKEHLSKIVSFSCCSASPAWQILTHLIPIDTRDKVCANIWYSSFILKSDACYTVYLYMAMHFTLLSPILIPITITFVCLKFDWSRILTKTVFIRLKWIRLKIKRC